MEGQGGCSRRGLRREFYAALSRLVAGGDVETLHWVLGQLEGMLADFKAADAACELMQRAGSGLSAPGEGGDDER